MIVRWLADLASAGFNRKRLRLKLIIMNAADALHSLRLRCRTIYTKLRSSRTVLMGLLSKWQQVNLVRKGDLEASVNCKHPSEGGISVGNKADFHAGVKQLSREKEKQDFLFRTVQVRRIRLSLTVSYSR